ncbi:MAG TPA: pyridoxamine 5'-phosphate oxidase family protein [Ramlibacter sp.]|uniref:pyridoxamine 5'-phosphate oxidase family protein n=1 Tax=Ramlibacter sp. TaxID=1917967 RepID=UPI002D80C7BF|nr:pyridoxamine 5'-phosphate oxidase family protein [Ramlibacter sp.]HET8745804.1 pyridoxamine 5'-phosphate oxidase family protein [Ramlibacter sp.]
MSSPVAWHEGELLLQARAGVAQRMEEAGRRLLRDHMPQQHRDFFAELPLLFAATLEADGQPRAALLAGEPGFASSPDPHCLRVAPAWSEGLPTPLQAGAPIGLLGLQAHTGRRNRLNGWVEGVHAGGFDVRVGQSFGNCPRHIHPRLASFAAAQDGATVSQLARLDERALAILRAADTFFIATAHPDAASAREPSQGIDVSHRGGPAGFVQVADGATLVVPDIPGNGFFNTLGNLQLEPRCGLLFLDFARGDRLWLAARGEVAWQGEARLLVLHVQSASLARGGLPLQWREMAAPP